MSRPVIILNPQARKGEAGRIAGDLQRLCERHLGACQLIVTSGPGDARRLAKSAGEEGRALVLAAGGDGTVSEVASGLVASGGASKLGILHLGTGGDLRRSLALPERLDQLLQLLARNQTRRIDAARLTYEATDGTRSSEVFVNVAAVGMAGHVDKYVSEAPQGAGAKAAYFMASLQALARTAATSVRIDIDSQPAQVLATRNLALCNGGYFGGGMHIAPRALLDDGELEVISLGGGRLATLGLATAVYAGVHVGRPGVFSGRGKHVVVTALAGSSLPLDIDGEHCGEVRALQAQVLPRALEVVA